MKFIAAILSVYFLGLTFVPCEDAVRLPDDNPEFHQLDISSHSPAHSDDCSPLCQCHCCHVHLTHFTNSNFEIARNGISTFIFEKDQHAGDEIPRSFFQPPRV